MKPAFKLKAGYKQSSFRYEFFPEQAARVAGATHYRAGHGVSRIYWHRRRYWRRRLWRGIAFRGRIALFCWIWLLDAAAKTLDNATVIEFGIA